MMERRHKEQVQWFEEELRITKEEVESLELEVGNLRLQLESRERQLEQAQAEVDGARLELGETRDELALERERVCELNSSNFAMLDLLTTTLDVDRDSARACEVSEVLTTAAAMHDLDHDLGGQLDKLQGTAHMSLPERSVPEEESWQRVECASVEARARSELKVVEESEAVAVQRRTFTTQLVALRKEQEMLSLSSCSLAAAQKTLLAAAVAAGQRGSVR